MKKIFSVSLFFSLVFALGCKKNVSQIPVTDDASELVTTQAAEEATAKEIVICDQKNARIVMVDVANSNTITWEWKPTASYAMIRSGAQGWFSNLSEAKPIYSGKYILATASGGGVAIINVSTKKAIWYDYAGGNTHSAEVLPNGNVVTASTTGGYLLIFTVDSYINDDSKQGGKVTFEDVHNVVWDKANNLLWAAGKDKLKAFSYNNSCGSPVLTLKKTYTMPQGNAHDLFPVYGSTTDLWLTNSGHVYKFNVSTGVFTLIKTISGAKSVCNGPDGYETILDVANGNGGETWRTDVITDLNGATVFKNTSFGMYKVRWKLVNSFSYPAGDSFHECTH
ncbi:MULTISPECIES: DUF6528 family protein [Niastella]|uniref:Bulb-type lectin domain-containing protein n=1 Tax=Niastella soli TaxID=2821487 RepID=A0ABS3YZR4_9BACT|nr:DUF6528 family protein [Niastella soli]MBO9203248.1 hypothetical protein [Niastella soli]